MSEHDRLVEDPHAEEIAAIRECIRFLQERYAEAAKPFFDRLAAIEHARSPARMTVTQEQARLMGLLP